MTQQHEKDTDRAPSETAKPYTPAQAELFEPATDEQHDEQHEDWLDNEGEQEDDDDLDEAETKSAKTFHDTHDSYIYGDSDATLEDTIETMTVYDPDADRFEDIEQSGDNETIICYSYSRKTGAPIESLAIEDVSRVLTNNNQFIWLGLYDPSL